MRIGVFDAAGGDAEREGLLDRDPVLVKDQPADIPVEPAERALAPSQREIDLVPRRGQYGAVQPEDCLLYTSRCV